MAKFRQIHTKIWADPDFQEYTIEQKVLFLYLCTNPLITESGIYPLTPRSASNDTGLSYESVKDILCNNKLKNILYDNENKYVFVIKFKSYNSGGKPSLVALSIQDDYQKSKQTPLWTEFTNHYPQYKLHNNGLQPLLNLNETVEQPLDNGSFGNTNGTRVLSTNSNYSNYSNYSKDPLDNSLPTVDQPLEQPLPPPVNIYSIYENNIGLITQIVAEELKAIETKYPLEWFIEAVKEAANNNVKSLKYIKAILQRWEKDGFKVDKRKKAKQDPLPKKYKDGVKLLEELREQNPEW